MKRPFLLMMLVFITLSAAAQDHRAKDTLIRDDYSNIRNVPRSKMEPFRLSEQILTECLVVVDSRIMRCDSDEYKRIPQDSLIRERFIQDTSSRSGIKHIYFYNRKK